MFGWDGAVGEITLSLFLLGGVVVELRSVLGCRVPLYEFCYIYKYWGRGLTLRFFFFWRNEGLIELYPTCQTGGTLRTVCPTSRTGDTFRTVCPTFRTRGTVRTVCPTFRIVGSFSNCGVSFSKKKGGASPFRTGPTSRTGRGEGNPN